MANTQDRIIVKNIYKGERGITTLSNKSLLELGDVSNTAPTDGQHLIYNANTEMWEAADSASAAVDLSAYAEVANTASVSSNMLARFKKSGNTVTLDTSKITLSDDGDLLSSPVWSDGALHTGVKVNVTDDNSDASSLLMDLQLGGSSKFRLRKDGVLTLNNTTAFIAAGPSNTSGINLGADNITNVPVGITYGVGLTLKSGHNLQWASGAVNAAKDLILTRDGANILAQRNGTNAQEFRLYNTYTDASNYENLALKFSGGNAYLSTNYSGTGSPRNLILESENVYVKTQSSHKFIVGPDYTRHLQRVYPNTNRVFAFGESDHRWSQLFAGNSLTGSDDGSVLDIDAIWDTTGVPTLIKANVTDNNSDASSLLMDLQVGGASKHKVDKSGNVTLGGNGVASITCNVMTYNGAIQLKHINGDDVRAATSNSGTPAFGWYNIGTQYAQLLSPAANILEQRRGANAQEFRLYNTYTDASNYERGFFKFDSNILKIGCEMGGTGILRDIQLGSGSCKLNVYSNRIQVDNGYLFLNGGTTGYLELGKQSSAPSASANRAKFYCEDNGSGKTRLMVQFGTGAAQQIAIEP